MSKLIESLFTPILSQIFSDNNVKNLMCAGYAYDNKTQFTIKFLIYNLLNYPTCDFSQVYGS